MSSGAGAAQARLEPLRAGACTIRAGTASWADRSLLQAGTFYPKRSMSASDRLGFYASRLSVAEVTTTARFPPTAALSAQWAERTPPGFVFDPWLWSLLSGGAVRPDSLWADLRCELLPARRESPRLYRQHLSADGRAECWARFVHALGPLERAGRLGTLLVRYPHWVGPREAAWQELADLPARLPGKRVAVELTHPAWFEGDRVEQTLGWLEDHGLGYVCVDRDLRGSTALGETAARGAPPTPAVAGADPGVVVAATADTSVVRFPGRRSVPGERWTWPYRYSTDELAGWVETVEALAASCTEVHLLFGNCHGSDAVDNAATLLELCRGAERGAPQSPAACTTDP